MQKKKKKCTRDKKSFVSCVLSKNRERIGLLLRQDGVLLRNGREKVELACPSLLCLSPERSSNQPSKQSSAHQTCAPSTHPAPDRRKDGATVRGIRILRPGIDPGPGNRACSACGGKIVSCVLTMCHVLFGMGIIL